MSKLSKLLLLVEDSKDDAFFFQRALQRAGLNNPLYCVPSGGEAVLYLTGEGEYRDRDRYPFPSVMFLDLGLPSVTGFDILESVRDHYPGEALLIVVLSGTERPDAVRMVSSLRADAFIAKPPRPEDLTNLARQFPSHF